MYQAPVVVLTLVCGVRKMNAADTVRPASEIVVDVDGVDDDGVLMCWWAAVVHGKFPNRKSGGCCWMVCCKNCRSRRSVLRHPLTSRMKVGLAKGRGMDRKPGLCTARAAAKEKEEIRRK